MTMPQDRYPKDLTLTVEDFISCGWKAVLAGATGKDYPSMHSAFVDAAKLAISEDRQTQGKVLWLLSDACSMMLSPDSVNQPFKPSIVFANGRSIIPDDFLEEDINFFAQIVDEVDDPWLKARLADLVWLKQHPREVKFALAAIDSYRTIPLDTDSWWGSGSACWQRAISLALMLRSGAGDRLAEMEASIITAFKSMTRQDNFLGLELSNLLKSNALGNDHSTMIATRLESLAREFENHDNFYSAREYFQGSADWFKAAGDDAKSTKMTVAMAEGWVKEALAKVSSDQPSHLAAANFYENAIQTYRTIPRSERSANGVDDRLTYLQKRLIESGEKSLEEMSVISSPGMDITQLVENARKSVQGKEPVEALKAFANLHSVANAKQLRESAIKNLRNHPLQALFPTMVMSHDGRVIAKRSGMGHSDTPTDDDEIRIRHEMIHSHSLSVGLVVQGCIWPALEMLLLEHRLREADFVALARQSPIVPIGRELLFGKALFAGYDRDFATALHLLAPQIEHMVRFHLKQAGVKTTTLDSNGIETEKGLSSLMDLPEAEKIFGEDLSFEIKAVFCDPSGPNLRNELSHGLIDVDACQSAYAIYAWWFGLKLVFNTFWNASRTDSESDEQGQET